MSLADDLREDAAVLDRLASRLLTRAAYSECDVARNLAGRLREHARACEVAEGDTLVNGIKLGDVPPREPDAG